MCTLLPKANAPKKNILGISIGATTYGIALLKGKSLEDWQMKTVHGRWSKLKLRIILLYIERYCEKNTVTHIALKIPDPLKSSKDIDALIRGIAKLTEKKQMKLYRYTITELKRHCEKRNKEGVMEYAANRYPEVATVMLRQKQTKQQYYIKLFEAVCTAMYCNEGEQ